MAQPVVKDSALAVVACPDHGEIVVLAMNALPGKVKFRGVEAQQDPNVLPGEVLDLINLIVKRETAGKMAHAGKLRILDDQGSLEFSPGMAVEVAAQHPAVL